MPTAAIGIAVAGLAVTAAGTGASLYLQSQAQADAKKGQKELAKRAAAAGRSTEAENVFEDLQLQNASLESALEEKGKQVAEVAAAAESKTSKVILVVVVLVVGAAIWLYLRKRKGKSA